jgi:hypothetical protein
MILSMLTETDDTLPVTLVTAGAGRPEDDAAFMRELIELRDGLAKKLRKKPSLAQMLELLNEPPSRKAFWAHRLAEPPTRSTFPPEARDCIRRAVGEAPMPAVTEVTARMIDAGAAMHWIGPDTGAKSHLVLMIAPDLDAIEIHANGVVSARRVSESPEASVTPVTTAQEDNGTRPESKPQASRSGVSVSRASVEQNERRQALGKSWADIIEAGLKALESEV